MIDKGILLTVLTAVGGSAVIVGALAKFIGQLWSDRLSRLGQFRQEIDLDLRNKRIDAYSKLWQSTSVLPKWNRNSELTYEDLEKFNEKLSSWYFNEGGVFLSRTAQQNCFAPLRKELTALAQNNETGLVTDEHYTLLSECCSRLRAALAHDIQSRRDGAV